MPDWEAIRREYETTRTPIRVLAATYNVSRSTLSDRSKMWGARPDTGHRTPDTKLPDIGQEELRPLHIVRSELPSVPSAVDGANFGIEALVEYLRRNARSMNLIEHVKAATALSQYNRIIVNAVGVQDEEEDNIDLITVDTRDLSAEQLALMKEFARRMRESEQQVG